MNGPEISPRSTSLDTWQQIDNSPPSWRPTTASTFGPGPWDPAEDEAFRAYTAARLAAIEPPPLLDLEAIPDPRQDPAFEPAPPGHWLSGVPAPSPAAPAAPLDTRGQDRLLRNDSAKVVLSATVNRAAAGRWEAGELEAGAWLQGRASALIGCRSVRAFRDAVCGTYLARPVSCRCRICPDCERSRSARLAARFAGLSLDMDRPVFWTFTVPNVAAGDLDRGVDWLLEAFRRLRRRAIFRGGPCRLAECDKGTTHRAAAGGVYALEITWSPQRQDWHPHVHVLADIPFVRWAEMRAAWRGATCDAIRYLEAGGGRVTRCAHRADDRGAPLDGCRGASIVWVNAVRGEPGSDERLGSIRETLKYTVGGLVKSDGTLDGAPDERLGDLLLALRHRRLVAGWGGWRNVTDEDPEDEAPDVLRGEDVPPELRGLPIHCPACGQAAAWEFPIEVPRRSCYLARDGTMRWRPPPRPAGAVQDRMN